MKTDYKRIWYHRYFSADDIALGTGLFTHLCYKIMDPSHSEWQSRINAAKAMALKYEVGLILVQTLWAMTDNSPECLTDPAIFLKNLSPRVEDLGIDCLSGLDCEPVKGYNDYQLQHSSDPLSNEVILAISKVPKFNYVLPDVRTPENLPLGLTLTEWGGATNSSYNRFTLLGNVNINEWTYRKNRDTTHVLPTDVIGLVVSVKNSAEYTPAEVMKKALWRGRDEFFFVSGSEADAVATAYGFADLA